MADFEEVGSGHSGAPGSAQEVVTTPGDVYAPSDEVHVYIVFVDKVSVDDGISAIEQ